VRIRFIPLQGRYLVVVVTYQGCVLHLKHLRATCGDMRKSFAMRTLCSISFSHSMSIGTSVHTPRCSRRIKARESDVCTDQPKPVDGQWGSTGSFAAEEHAWIKQAVITPNTSEIVRQIILKTTRLRVARLTTKPLRYTPRADW
jgi:hypothetical protein